jgi:hypothetical protein
LLFSFIHFLSPYFAVHFIGTLANGNKNVANAFQTKEWRLNLLPPQKLEQKVIITPSGGMPQNWTSAAHF